MPAIIPASYDASGGIRRWPWFANNVEGDCTVAAFLHLVMIKGLSTASTWRKIIYRLGFAPPVDAVGMQEYTAYLATQGQTPSPTTGVDAGVFLQWAFEQEKVVAFARVYYKPMLISPDASDLILHDAMIDFTGLLLEISLTWNSYYNDFWSRTPWHIGPAPHDQPDGAINHSVAFDRYNSQYDVLVTWARNKCATHAFTQDTTYCAYAFLTGEEADFDFALAKLKLLPGAVF